MPKKGGDSSGANIFTQKKGTESNPGCCRKERAALIGRGFTTRLKTVYANLKIKQKLFLLQCLTVLLFGSVCLMGIQIAFNLYDGMLYDQSAKVLNLSTVNIENELKRVETVSLSLFSHPDIQAYLRRLQNSLPELERAKIGNTLTEILWVYVFERNINTVNLIDSHSNQYSGGAAIPREMLGAILARAAAKEGSPVFIAPFANDPSLFCARQIREIRNLSLKPLGTLAIRINMDSLVQHSTAGEANHSGNLLIRSGGKEIYASSGLARRIGKRIRFDRISGYQVRKIDGRSYFLAHTISPASGWMYVNILPYDNIFHPVMMLRSVIAIIFGLMLAGTLGVILKIAYSLTQPIENLSSQMKRVEKGDFTLDETALSDAGRADEIGDLQRDFTIMIQKINALIQEDYTQQIIIKDTQFRALQAQINPHFLYNTMDSINWMAKLHGEPEISRMVEALGNLLRCAISNKASLNTMEQEMALLQDYIAIQQIRFGERLLFEMKIAPEWRKLPIPKLTLQPIVENSIKYGLEVITGVCRIAVTARETGGFLEIRVTDNGPGIDPDILAKLSRGEVLPSGSGIGLQNIDDRLRLMFGERYGLKVEPGPDGGGVVLICIPTQEAGDV
jgi:two-component system sensor histidine kinase YesM